MESVLIIKNLTKRYKYREKNVLDGLNLAVKKGEIYGFLGPNGAGKSTTIKILSGLISYNSGTISIFGKNLHEHKESLKQNLGIVPQDIALFPSLTAVENLKVFGGIYGIKKEVLHQRIENLLQMFGLLENKKRKVAQFSGGMKRRLNLIVGILHEPSLLMLDEPTVGIDVQSKTVILENLKKLNEQGTTILYTSHDMNEAQMLCSKVGIIDEGRIVIEGTPNELIAQSLDYTNLESVYLKLTGKMLRD